MPPATVVREIIGDPKSCEARPVVTVIQVVCVHVKPEFPLGRRRRSHLVRWTRTRFNVLDSSNHQFSFHKTDVNMTWLTKTNLCAVRRPEPFCSFFYLDPPPEEGADVSGTGRSKAQQAFFKPFAAFWALNVLSQWKGSSVSAKRHGTLVLRRGMAEFYRK